MYCLVLLLVGCLSICWPRVYVCVSFAKPSAKLTRAPTHRHTRNSLNQLRPSIAEVERAGR